MTTFEQLRKAAAGLGDCVRGNLADRVDAVLDSARVNADDTVYADKSRPVAEYDAVAMASVESVLCCTDDAETRAWFISQGVRF